MFLKQSTAVDILIGPFVDEDDGKTLEEALTISQGDVMLSKNGQALAQKNDNTACVFDDFGCYNCELDATDTNTVGLLTVVVFEDGALPFRRDYQVVEEAIYDALMAASAAGFDANQRVNVGQWLSQAVTLSTGNKPDVNIDEISDDATAPANLEADYDGTGYAGGTINKKADVVAITDGLLTAAKFGADFLTAAKVAADVSTEIAAAVWAAATRTLTALGFTLGAADLAADTITAAKIAPDAIGASELAADAVTEIQSGLATAAGVSAVETDTQDIQSRLPAALVSGRIDASVGAVAAGVIAAASFAAGAFDAVWTVAVRVLTAATNITARLPIRSGTKRWPATWRRAPPVRS